MAATSLEAASLEAAADRTLVVASLAADRTLAVASLADHIATNTFFIFILFIIN